MPKDASSRAFMGVVLVIIGALCWGFSATCGSFLMGNFGIEVPWLVSIRLGIVGPMFLILAAAIDRKRLVALLRSPRMLLIALANALVSVILIQFAYMSSVRYAGAGNALLMQETGLVFLMIVVCIMARRLPAKRELAGLVLALLGTVAIATQGNFGSLGIDSRGLMWGMINAFALVGYNLIPTKLLDEYGSLVTNGVSMTMGMVIVEPIIRPWETPVQLPIEGWAALAAIVVLGTFVAYLAYLQGLKYAGAVKAGLLGVFEPLSGIFFSAVWLGDVVTLYDGVGCVAIVAMMVLMALPDKTVEAREPQGSET